MNVLFRSLCSKVKRLRIYRSNQGDQLLLRIVQGIGILIAVGMLIEFLPIDLAIVLVTATATQAWIWLRVIRQYFMPIPRKSR